MGMHWTIRATALAAAFSLVLGAAALSEEGAGGGGGGEGDGASKSGKPCETCGGGGRMKCPSCKPCATCGGDGAVECERCGGEPRDCKRCDGQGYTLEKRPVIVVGPVPRGGGQRYEIVKVRCGTCSGKGTIRCRDCKGAGSLKCKSCRGAGKETGCVPCGDKRTAACTICGGGGTVSEDRGREVIARLAARGVRFEERTARWLADVGEFHVSAPKPVAPAEVAFLPLDWEAFCETFDSAAAASWEDKERRAAFVDRFDGVVFLRKYVVEAVATETDAAGTRVFATLARRDDGKSRWKVPADTHRVLVPSAPRVGEVREVPCLIRLFPDDEAALRRVLESATPAQLLATYARFAPLWADLE